MEDLKIDFEAADSLGTQITEKGADFKELLNKINSTNSVLKTYWEGSDASKYSTEVEEQAKYMQQLNDTINDIGSFLVKVGKAYSAATQANMDAIK